MWDPESGTGARNYDDLVNERFSRFSQDEECTDFSYQSVNSCPSPSRSGIDHLNYYTQHVHGDSGAQQSRRHFYYDEQMRSFESGKSGGLNDDQMRSSESSRSSGLYRSNGSGSGNSSIGQLRSGTSDAGGDCCSSISLVCFTIPILFLFYFSVI